MLQKQIDCQSWIDATRRDPRRNVRWGPCLLFGSTNFEFLNPGVEQFYFIGTELTLWRHVRICPGRDEFQEQATIGVSWNDRRT